MFFILFEESAKYQRLTQLQVGGMNVQSLKSLDPELLEVWVGKERELQDEQGNILKTTLRVNESTMGWKLGDML